MKSFRTFLLFISIVILLIFGSTVFAANRTASVSGNWSNTATWGGLSVPVAGDDVFIGQDVTVTVDMAAECASISFDAGNLKNAILTISGSNTLTVTGLIDMERPPADDSCIINVNAGTLSCGSLEMNANTANRYNIINISTGTLTVSGSLTANNDGCEITFTGAGTLSIAGATSGAPTMTTVSGSTVNYTGSVPQTVFSGTYNGTLSISGAGSKTIDAATTVNGTLVLSEGTLENSTYLTMGDGSTISRSQGALANFPTFSGTVNNTYTGGSSVTTSYEVPVSTSVLNNLTVNSGGVVQGGTPGSIVNILNFSFANLGGWTGDKGRSNNEFTTRRTNNAGGSSKECRYTYGSSSSTVYTASIYRMESTAGYASVNVSWKQFIDNYDADNFPYTIKVQCASSSGGPWTDMYSYTPTGSANIGPETRRVSNWTTDVGGDFYIRFYITGYTYGLDYWYFDDVIVDGQDQSVPSTVIVNGTMDLTSGGYSIQDNTLSLAGGVSGSNTLSGGTASNLMISGAGSNLSLPVITGGLNDFTISRGNGVTLGDHLTVNGILDLQSANPSSTLGLLETGTDTLTMAEAATTTGSGDVTGYVKRNSFSPDVYYSFGNEFTNIIFASGGTYPDQIVVNIDIGTSPSWKTTAIERVYDFVQNGGDNCFATISTHYLDSELNSLDENDLVHWTNGTPGPPLGLYSWGKSGNSTTENWVTIANVGIENFPIVFGQLENTLDAADPPEYTWDGSTDSVWSTSANWTPDGVPTGVSNIVIPDATTTSNDPALPASAAVNTLRIESGGILNAVASASFTVNGANGAWANEGGTFNASTSNITFTDTAATVAGSTDFYDLTVATGAELTPAISSYMGIANALTLSGTGILNAVLLHNTIDYNGAGQTVINPNGATSGYHNLILSGSGTKTMPGSDLSVAGEFSLSGTASASVADTLTVGESIIIGSGTTLNLGSYTHTIGGNLTNNGTLTSSSASINFNGTGSQTITNSAGFSFDTLTISNTSDTVMLGTSTNLSVAGDLVVDAGAVIDLGTNNLSSLTGDVNNAGAIITQSTSVTPFPSGKTWGGDLILNGAAAQTLVAGTYNDLEISGTSGATTGANITVNGILSLQAANASATQGLLHTGTDTLFFGASSTTVGEGEVTGIMTRTTLLPDVTYSFGHEYTYVNYPNVGTLPSKLSVKLALGAAPAWRTGAINRIFDLSQTGGTGTQAILYSHYLDSELNGNSEENLVDFVYFATTPLLVEYGRSGQDTVNNWLSISNVNMAVFAPIFGLNEITFDEAELDTLTWNGSSSDSWVTAFNWTPIGAPSDSTVLIIPDASTTTFDLTLPALATCKSITIESGGIVNASAGSELTVNGSGNVWNNSGTFNPGTGTVVFTNSNDTLSGTHDFNNIIIESEAGLYLENGAYLGISGTLTNLGTLGTYEDGTTTVEYKGASQDIAPSSRLSNTYSTLILSGSGTKTLPSVPMNILADFTLSGTVDAVADTSITVEGDLDIGSGTTFTTGEQSIYLEGNLANNGTLTGTDGNVIFSGTLEQSFTGASATTFDSLTIDNTAGVLLDSDALTTVSGALTINSGRKLTLPASRQLTVSGTLINSSDSSGLVLQSTALGTGSLIHETAGVDASVERYMRSDSWHIFSPSVAGQAIPDFVTNAANNVPTSGSNYGMMFYSESGGGWQYYTDPATGNIGPGSGYLLRHTADDAVAYYGALNEASVGVAITRAANGWNGLGNPFPSSIGVREDASTSEDFLTYNAAALDPSYAALYLWDEPVSRVSGVSYYKVISNAAFTPSRPVLDQAYMQPGQGFLVKSVTGGATVTFTKAMRVHDNTESFVKSSRPSWPGIVLSAEAGSRSASTSITFHRDMTTGLDITYDAGLLGGDPSFKLYSRLIEDNGINFMLQCLPDYGFENRSIPLGLDSKEALEVTFSAEMLDIPQDCGAYLEDRKTGVITDLKGEGSSYTVQLDSAIAGMGRFYLHLFNQVTSAINEDKAQFTVYTLHKEIVVKGAVQQGTNARLVDLSGRIVRTYELINEELNILPAFQLPTGIYILQIYGNGLNEYSRLFIE